MNETLDRSYTANARAYIAVYTPTHEPKHTEHARVHGPVYTRAYAV